MRQTPSRFFSGRKSVRLGSESPRVAALGCVRGRFALHRAVLAQVSEADLPSARSWREPPGAGHVRRDALRLHVPSSHLSEVEGRVEVAVLLVPAGVVIAGEDTFGEVQLG